MIFQGKVAWAQLPFTVGWVWPWKISSIFHLQHLCCLSTLSYRLVLHSFSLKLALPPLMYLPLASPACPPPTLPCPLEGPNWEASCTTLWARAHSPRPTHWRSSRRPYQCHRCLHWRRRKRRRWSREKRRLGSEKKEGIGMMSKASTISNDVDVSNIWRRSCWQGWTGWPSARCGYL